MNKSISLPEKDITRFWSKVKIGSPDECWDWQAGNNGKNGYGKFHVGREGKPQEYAHRVSWEISNGEIPKGIEVLHKCDNPPCVNPNHLFLGTQADNMKDASEKGRHHGSGVRGEECGRGKLTESDIPEIRKMIADGVYLHVIGKKYGVSRQSIFYIKTRRNWSWIK